MPVQIGTRGDVVTVRSFFNGWGYVHLFANNAGKRKELDTYPIPDAMDARFATAFGELSVHEDTRMGLPARRAVVVTRLLAAGNCASSAPAVSPAVSAQRGHGLSAQM